jgi:RNA polymerase sigma-70 factor (ECF subfamily)
MSSLALPFAAVLPSLVAPFAGREPALARRPAAADPASERAWVDAARGGDADAFRRLVERHQRNVVELAARIVRSREEAEEAAQDAFVRAWRALPSFRGEARFSTWLHRIATRCALDAAGRRKRREQREEAGDPARLAAVAECAGGLEGPEQRRLRRVLAELDPTPRAVVALFYLGGRSVAEVAETLRMPEGTVKTHLHRARGALRRAWVRESTREERLGLPRF